eukprot:Gb_37969 [translate_table: standard]
MAMETKNKPILNNFCTVLLRYLLVIILGVAPWNGLKIKASSLNYSDFTVLSAFKYPKTRLKHYDWRYFRVELPSGFSGLSIALTTDWVSENRDLIGLSNSTTPLVCFRSGGPPLPGSGVELDVVMAISVRHSRNISNVGQCAWFRESLIMNLTNEQVSSGILYLGFFNGVGPVRTQSKMITRGSTYTFGVEIIVFGCKDSSLGGPHCNNTINSLTCVKFDLFEHPRKLYENSPSSQKHELTENPSHLEKGILHQLSWLTQRNCLLKFDEHVDGKNNGKASFSEGENKMDKKYHLLESTRHGLRCTNSLAKVCIRDGEWKFYSLHIVDISSQLDIMVEYESFNLSASANGNKDDGLNDTINKSDVGAMFYVSHNALPQKTVYEYLIPIGQSALSIQFPKLGWWYIGVHFSNQTTAPFGKKSKEKDDAPFCFVLKWRIFACIPGKAGEDCRWQSHTLQRVKRVGARLPFESHYLPIYQQVPTKSEQFPLEPFFSTSSIPEANQDLWTFFVLEVPHGAAGGVVSVDLKSSVAISFEIYARFGSLPTLHNWDYYTNVSDAAESSMFMTLKKRKGQTNIHLNIIYPMEGIWCLGVRRFAGLSLNLDDHEVTMHVSLQGCPTHCSKHGTCHHAFEESGLTIFSYCSCDRTHGGFDCSMELVSPKGHKQQSMALIVSNVAAILPGLWSIRQKAYAEWILYTTSGISSALYHSCDVGSWCVLSFHVLQFMDFWLSFMAVVATFIYMAAVDENTKVAIYTGVAIITALIAASGPTRTINIILVVIIGTLGLLFGWMVEFVRADQYIIWRPYFSSTMRQRWQAMIRGLQNLMEKLQRRFRWRFICIGFLALGASSLSWHFETVETYWFWHSLWHISIYSSSFFFLCSTISKSEANNQNSHTSYERVPPDIHHHSSDSTSHTELVPIHQQL